MHRLRRRIVVPVAHLAESLGVDRAEIWAALAQTVASAVSRPGGVLSEPAMFQPSTDVLLRNGTILALRDSSLEFVGGLHALRYLRITHVPKIGDLEPLRRLDSLEVLRLHTSPGWDSSGNRTIVRSLAPIAALRALRHLELFSVVPPDRSLSALEHCNALVTARFHDYPKGEDARFEAVTGLADDHAPKPGWATS